MSTKQRLWDFIRRNKSFTPKTMAIIGGFSYQTLRNFLIPLEIAGVLKVQNKSKFMKRVYLLNTKMNEVTAPKVNWNRVYLHKEKLEVDVGAKALLLKEIKQSSQGRVAQQLGISKASINLLVHNKYQSPALMYKKIREMME